MLKIPRNILGLVQVNTLRVCFIGAVIFPSPYLRADEPYELTTMEVTGSHIRRTDMEGVSPLLILGEEEIQRSGATTLNELFRKFIYNAAGTIDEQLTQGFAPASAGINLRGLGLTRTLVLVDGRRMPIFPFGQGGVGSQGESFVDINLIPLAAIERVEVLKDGASAIYGADTVAGVVNIILHKEYEGAIVSGQYGLTLEGDGEEGHLSIIAGQTFDKTSLTIAVNHFDRSPVMASDRRLSESANGPIDDRSRAGNPGTLIRADSGPEPDPRCLSGSVVGPFCKFDFAPYVTLIPEAQRTGVTTAIEHKIDDTFRVFARAMFTHTDSQRALAPAASLFNVSDQNTHNPFPGEDLQVIYRLLELGPRIDAFETNAYNLLGGVIATFDSWDFELGVGRGDISTTHTGISGYATEYILQAAIDEETLNVFGDSPDFDAKSVRFRSRRKGKSSNYFVDIKATGEVLEMPHGVLSVAFGAEYRKETFSDTVDAATASGAVIGTGGTSGAGDRDITAAYLEWAIPLLSNLDVQLAGRYDYYSDFGSTFNPKLGLRWKPLDTLLFRAGMGTGFKAPAMHELYSGETTGHESVLDTSNCDAARQAGNSDLIERYCNKLQEIHTTISGNSALEAEESESYSLGVIWDVMDSWNIVIDYWRIENKHAVAINPQFIVDHENLFPGDIKRDQAGDIVTVNSQFQNVGEQTVWGIDVDNTINWTGGVAGDFQLATNAAYLGSFKQQPASGQKTEEWAGYSGKPDWRVKNTLSWRKRAYAASLTLNYVDGYQRRQSKDSIGSWTTLDLQSSWYPGFTDGASLTFGMDNILDQAPPEDPFLEGWPFFNRALHNPRGRFLYLRYQHAF